MAEGGNELGMEQPAERGFEILPVEVRATILGFLENEDLLTSRLVCNDWRRIVDEVYETKIWKPHFANSRVAEALLLFRVRIPGTRFSGAEEVEQFMENNPEDQDPFINRTLILGSRYVEQFAGLCQVFPRLVARFGRFIWHCVYFVHHEVPESVHNITNIFQMTDLRSLTIYCANWDRGVIRQNINITNNADHPLKDFQSLTVLGDQSYIFLRPISAAFGPQIKRLRCWEGYLNLLEDPSPEFATFPNLEEFKACGISFKGLRSLTKDRWPLKRLSMKIRDFEAIDLDDVLDSINEFAGTLESFHLQIKEHQLLDRPRLTDRMLELPNVTDLRVPYFFTRRCINEMSSCFMNMKHLQLVDHKDMIPKMLANNGNRIEIIGETLEPLWEALPASLEMISVRYRKYRDEAPERGIIHKYFQMRSDLNRN